MPIAARKNTVSEGETPIDSTKYNQEIDNIYTVLNQVLKFYASATSPADPQANQTWLDTTTTPALLRRFDGTVWRWTGMYVGTTIPSNPIAGAIFIHGTTGSISSYTGTAWLPLGAEGVVFDPTGTILTATDVDAAIKELIVDYQAAEAAKEEALGAASNAGTYMGQAQAAKTAAETAQSGAQTARTGAETAQGASETARDLAQKWASEVEDVEVSGGEYSAKHYAAKAAVSASIADHSVKASIGDASPGYLDAKVDNATIEVAEDKLRLKSGGHSHAQSEISGLVDALAAKAGTAVATTSANGLMSAEDKTKSDGIPSPSVENNGKVLGVTEGAFAFVEGGSSDIPAITTATTIYVNSGAAFDTYGAGDDSTGDGSAEHPYATYEGLVAGLENVPKFLLADLTIFFLGTPHTLTGFSTGWPNSTNGIIFYAHDPEVTLNFVYSGSAAPSVAVSTKAVTITVATTGATLAAIASAIKASAAANVLIWPVIVGTSTTNCTTAMASFVGFSGGNPRTYGFTSYAVSATTIRDFFGHSSLVLTGSMFGNKLIGSDSRGIRLFYTQCDVHVTNLWFVGSGSSVMLLRFNLCRSARVYNCFFNGGIWFGALYFYGGGIHLVNACHFTSNSRAISCGDSRTDSNGYTTQLVKISDCDGVGNTSGLIVNNGVVVTSGTMHDGTRTAANGGRILSA